VNKKLILEHIPPRHWWQRAQWRVIHPLVVNTHMIERGFITDGLSVPYLLFWLVSPTGKAMRSAVLHDYLLSMLQPWQSRMDADNAFLESMNDEGISAWRAYCMFAAVRVYGIVKVGWFRLWH